MNNDQKGSAESMLEVALGKAEGLPQFKDHCDGFISFAADVVPWEEERAPYKNVFSGWRGWVRIDGDKKQFHAEPFTEDPDGPIEGSSVIAGHWDAVVADFEQFKKTFEKEVGFPFEAPLDCYGHWTEQDIQKIKKNAGLDTDSFAP